MVDMDRIRELVPHYIAMLAIVFLTIFLVRVTVGDLGFWIELAIVVIVAAAYQPLVRRLGVAPDAWER